MHLSNKKLESLIRAEFGKEYACHLQFVQKIAKDLWREKGGNLVAIEAAAIAHDYGRGKEKGEESHEITGSRILFEILPKFGYDTETTRIVCACTKKHNGNYGFESIEEEIIANADGASKILFHEAFMLMCKKDSFSEKAAWGMKYLEKGFGVLTFQELKEKCEEKKDTIELIYKSIITS